jgi:hypothetical protein
MIVAPEAIVKSFFEHRLKYSAFSSSQLHHSFALILSGARLAFPMVVAPEAIRGCLQPIIDASISSSQLIFLA